MIRAVPLAAALTALAIAGCGAPARAPDPPGTTLVLLENRVESPCDLTFASAQLDETQLERSIIAPPGSPPAILERKVLRSGPHMVSITATAACSGADPGAVLQFAQPVYTRTFGTSITIVLTRDAAAPSGLAASLKVEGGEVLSPRADGGEVNCFGRMPVDRAICRTEGALARARANRDVVLTLCISEKLREMRLATETLSTSPAPSSAPQDPALQEQEESVARRVLTLASEADQCIGFEMMGDDGTRRTPTPRSTLTAFH
ncbi:MAG: hypothetical protein R3F14_36690 [Polyangiaceae bacterium]